MGGMLAYDTAATSSKVRGLITTCFLDARLREVRKSVVRWSWLAVFIPAILKLAPSCLNSVLLPMPILGKGICNDEEITRRIIRDKCSGGNWMPLGFLRTWLQSSPAEPPEEFQSCPVLMIHPADDRWTDVEISEGFFGRLETEKQEVLLENAGHFPIESPGKNSTTMLSWISLFYIFSSFLTKVQTRLPFRSRDWFISELVFLNCFLIELVVDR